MIANRWLWLACAAVTAMGGCSTSGDANGNGDGPLSGDLAGADFAGADFAGVDLAGADFAGVDFASVDLAGVDLAGSTASGLYTNGSRLIWQTLTTSDGLESFYDPYDTQLATMCYPQTANDGQLRCLPATSTFVGGYFSDAGCTTPIALLYCATATPAYAEQYAANQQITMYQVTGSYGGTLYSGTPGSCNSVTLPMYSAYTLAALAPSTFAAVTQQLPGSAAPSSSDYWQNGTRIKAGTISSSDGFSGPWQFYDTQLATTCYFGVAGDGVERCLATRTAAVASYYSDASCTAPLLETTPSATAPYFQYAYTIDSRGCATSSYYQVGGLYGGTPYTGGGTSACTTAPVDATHAYYSLSPISVGTFESGTVSAGAGPFAGFKSGTRMQLSSVSSADGARLGNGFHDAQLGIDCYFSNALDGSYRCVPVLQVAYATGAYFADASCSVPLALGFPCRAAPAYVQNYATCAGGYSQLGAIFSGTPYSKSGTSCVSTTIPATFTLYRIGAAVPASTFALGTITP
jgi:hypothetical protein